MDNIGRNPLQEPRDRSGKYSGSLEDSYNKIETCEFWTRTELATEVSGKLRQESDWINYFERGDPYTTFWAFPSEVGKDRVRKEFPEIWNSVLGQGEKKATNEEGAV